MSDYLKDIYFFLFVCKPIGNLKFQLREIHNTLIYINILIKYIIFGESGGKP